MRRTIRLACAALLPLLLLAPAVGAKARSLTSVSPATITGEPRWDHTLTASPGTWRPAPTSTTYQWLRNGTPIAGADQPTRTLTVADFGTVVAVRIRVHRNGHLDAVATPSAGVIGHRVPVRKGFTYSIASRGQLVTSLDEFAQLAAETYANPQGWRAAGFEIARVDSGGDFTLVLADADSMTSFSPACSATWSCRVGRDVIINQTRWLHASPTWNAAGLSLRGYQDMVVNHETGHWLGHPHAECGGVGQPAPVMMPQSKGLNGCRFNPWPLPSERWTSR